MPLTGISAILFKSAVLARPAKIAGSGLVGLAVLGWIAGRSGPPTGRAVVHVVEADVEVTIGGIAYRIEGRRYAPIVCELPTGRHDLAMRREGRLLFRESFSLRGGDSVVLTAWDPERLREQSAPSEATVGPHAPGRSSPNPRPAISE